MAASKNDPPEKSRASRNPSRADVSGRCNGEFVEECRRQARLAASADQEDKDLLRFLDAALTDLPYA